MRSYIFYEAKTQKTLFLSRRFQMYNISWAHFKEKSVIRGKPLRSRFLSKEFCNMYVNTYVNLFLLLKLLKNGKGITSRAASLLQ